MSSTIRTLADIVEFIRNGLAIDNRNGTGGIPITRIETISEHSIDDRRVGYAGVEAGQRDEWLLKVGDILFSHINSVTHLGKCALYEGQPTQLLHGMNLLNIRPNPCVVLPRYLLRALRANTFRSQLAKHIKPSVNQASVSIAALKGIVLTIPPLDEQRRIADILDRADAIRRKRKQAIALTEQLLRSTFLEIFGDPITNPKAWPVKLLGELLATEPRIGTLVPASNIPGTLVVRVGELGAYDVDLSRTKRAALPNADLERYGLETGDVLLARAIGSEDHLGKASVLQLHNEPVAFDSHVMRLRFREQVLDPYVFVQWMRTPGGRARFMTQAGRTAVQFNVNGKQIVKVQIPLPPISEQERFRRVFDAVRAMQTSFSAASAAGDACFDVLVNRSFSST